MAGEREASRFIQWRWDHFDLTSRAMKLMRMLITYIHAVTTFLFNLGIYPTNKSAQSKMAAYVWAVLKANVPHHLSVRI